MAEGQLKHAKGRAEGICWRYCHGLQIAGRPSYVRDSGIRPLPGAATWGDAPLQASLTGCLRQAMALCGESSQRCPTGRNLGKRTPLAWAQHCLPHHLVWQAENWAPATVLDMVGTSVHAGGLALLHFTPDHQASRWVLVTGVEQVWQTGRTGSSAWGPALSLLVLDPGTPLVWNCGHNLRLVPMAPTAPASKLLQKTRTEATHTSWYLHTLDGGYSCGIGHAALLCHPRPDRSDPPVNPVRPCSFI